MKFDRFQEKEIKLGKEHGLNTRIYEDLDFDSSQMREIRLGLERRLEIEFYADQKFSAVEMEQIRLGLERGLNVSLYANTEFDATEMREMRMRLEQGLSVSFEDNQSLGDILDNMDLPSPAAKQFIGEELKETTSPSSAAKQFEDALSEIDFPAKRHFEDQSLGDLLENMDLSSPASMQFKDKSLDETDSPSPASKQFEDALGEIDFPAERYFENPSLIKNQSLGELLEGMDFPPLAKEPPSLDSLIEKARKDVEIEAREGMTQPNIVKNQNQDPIEL